MSKIIKNIMIKIHEKQRSDVYDRALKFIAIIGVYNSAFSASFLKSFTSHDNVSSFFRNRYKHFSIFYGLGKDMNADYRRCTT